MKLFDYVNRMNLLNKLLKDRKTGTPKQLAKRLGLSVSRLYVIMEDLKIKGAPICYCRQIQSYYYTQAFEISLKADFIFLNPQELKNTNAGFLIKNAHYFFCRVDASNLAFVL